MRKAKDPPEPESGDMNNAWVNPDEALMSIIKDQSRLTAASELKKANNMWMTLEEYKKLPKCLDREDYENVIWYTYSVAKGEDYDEAIDYIVENHIRNPDERIQANAIGALYDVVIRFYDMKDNVMPFLAESLVSSNKDIRGHAFDVLGKIERLVPRLKKTVHNIFFSQKLDFFADKELKSLYR